MVPIRMALLQRTSNLIDYLPSRALARLVPDPTDFNLPVSLASTIIARRVLRREAPLSLGIVQLGLRSPNPLLTTAVIRRRKDGGWDR